MDATAPQPGDNAPRPAGAPGAQGSAWRRFRARFDEPLRMLWIIRFPLLVAAITVVALVAPAQTAEVFRVLTEDAARRPLRLLAAVLALLLLSVQLWYFSRVALYLLAPGAIDREDGAGSVARHAPRLVAMAPIAAVAFLVMPVKLTAAGGVELSRGASLAAWALFGVLIIGGAALYAALWARRRIFHGATPAPPSAADERRFRALPRSTQSIVLLSSGASLAFFLAFVFEPLIAERIGAAAILLIAAALWVPFGGLLCWLGQRYRFPFLTALFALALLWGLLDRTDNHAIRRVASPSNALAGMSVADVFEEWLGNRSDLDDYEEYPVVLVSAEGGGIYAAYHAAMALAYVQDASPRFAQHVFAISGVSGGSVGAAVFAALCADRASNSASPAPAGQPLMRQADEVLGRDLLAPLVAAGLFQDLVQRFIPIPIGRFDRARALDRSLEAGWRDAGAATRDRFERDFESLWADFSRDATPALLLNTTSVETGRRVVLSNLPLEGWAFDDIEPLRDWLPDESPPLSTAALMSARFPIVTPAATVPLPGGGKRRVADGGYFENSGVATLVDLMTAIGADRARDLGARFIVLRIEFEKAPFVAPTGLASIRTHFLGEPLSPPRALLSTRSARGGSARHALLRAADSFARAGVSVQIFPIELREEDIPLPLGWLLSESAQADIERQLTAPEQTSAMLLEEVASITAAPSPQPTQDGDEQQPE